MDLTVVGFTSGNWIDLAEDRDEWCAYIRSVMDIGFLKSQLVSFTPEPKAQDLFLNLHIKIN